MYQDFEGENKTERLVIQERATRRDVIDYAISQEWTALATRERTAQRLFQYVWRTDARDATIFYLEDEDFGYAYLEVESPDRGALERTVAAARRAGDRLPTFTDDEVFDRFEGARTEDERLGAIYLVSLAAPRRAEPRFEALFERASADPAPTVRRGAIFAMSQAGWPEFRPLLARMAERDGDETVRATAESLLDSYARQERGELQTARA